MSDTKHTFAEAFCLMWYACPCGHRERIWNSRDGITPFGMDCPSCGDHTLRHVEWKRDTAAPDHRLHRRQRYWRDGTKAEADTIMRQRIAACKGTEYEVTDPARIEEIVASAVNATEGEFATGWPMLDTANG